MHISVRKVLYAERLTSRKLEPTIFLGISEGIKSLSLGAPDNLRESLFQEIQKLTFRAFAPRRSVSTPTKS